MNLVREAVSPAKSTRVPGSRLYPAWCLPPLANAQSKFVGLAGHFNVLSKLARLSLFGALRARRYIFHCHRSDLAYKGIYSISARSKHTFAAPEFVFFTAALNGSSSSQTWNSAVQIGPFEAVFATAINCRVEFSRLASRAIEFLMARSA